MKRKISSLLIWMALVCAPCVAISDYKGIQPGRSTRDDVSKALGQPIKEISATVFEYALAPGQGTLFIEYRADSQVVERIERDFTKPISRAAMIKSLSLPESPEEKETNKEGKLVEYFGSEVLSLTYASGEVSSGVRSVCYYSTELYDRLLNHARNPPVQFDAAGCRDLYFWAQTERDVAKRAKDLARHQAILEIQIASQRGDCQNARKLAESYKQKYISVRPTVGNAGSQFNGHVEGTWCFRGIPGQLCRITDTSTGALQLRDEQGMYMTGRLDGNKIILIPPFPVANGVEIHLEGTITDSGNRIQWSNGENWVRCDR